MPRAKSQKSNLKYSSFGDSYSSLILGVIVVIIGTILLLSLVRNRNIEKTHDQLSQVPQSITQVTQTNMETVIKSVTSTPAVQTQQQNKENKPTPSPIGNKLVNENRKPTSVPTQKAVALKTDRKQAVNQMKEENKGNEEKNYTVKKGDNLWSIALAHYKSGYNWVDIARANKLSNPNKLTVGMSLNLPNVAQKNATSEPEWTGLNSSSSTMQSTTLDRITSDSYKIQKGDTLWKIAVRAYGDGYKWSNIAKANKLSNPNRIYSGNVLSIPR